MAETMNEAPGARRKRRGSGWKRDVAICQEWITYWRARMDRLRVGDVPAELGELEEKSRHLAGWLERVERVGTVPSGYAKEAFGVLAERERVLAEHLKGLREKLGWCFK